MKITKGSLRLRSGETIAFGYDALGRETLRDLPGAAANDVYSAYDLAGRRQSARFASAGGSGIIYAYDSAGRLASETSTLGAARALIYQYDTASNRTRITWPDSVYAQYDYDALNRVSAIRENGAASGPGVLAMYAYDPLSRRVSITRGNGTVSTYAYDSASRMTALTQDLSGGTTNDQTYGFSYTAASQIAQRTAANDNYNWTAPNVTRTYNRNGLNQYTSVSGTGLTYDARGNLTSDGARTFAYDLENHLTSVSGPTALSLAYDPLGRLRSTTAAGATTDFLYDGDRLVAEYNGAGIVLRRYVHGPGVDEPLVWYEGSNLSDRRYLAADHLGSIIATNDNAGATTIQAYGPYGEPQTWTGSRFRYTGQMALPEVQLYHYRARVYDPVLGRFLQTDPIGYEDDINLYAYVRNDPVNGSDPTGTCGAFIGACIGAAIEIVAQAADPATRASYGRAIEAAGRGDFGGALRESGGNLARIGISAAAGQVGQFGAARVAQGASALARGNSLSVRAAERVVAYGNVAGNATVGAVTNAGAQVARNELTGDNGSVGAAALGGAGGGALGGVTSLAGRGGAQTLSDATGNFIGTANGQVAAPLANQGGRTAATEVGGAALARGYESQISRPTCPSDRPGC